MASDTLDLDKARGEIEAARARAADGDINNAFGAMTACALLLADEVEQLRSRAERLTKPLREAEAARDFWFDKCQESTRLRVVGFDKLAATRAERDELRAEVARLHHLEDTARASAEALRGLLAYYEAQQNISTSDPGTVLVSDGVTLTGIGSLIDIESSHALDAADDAVGPHVERARVLLAAVDALPERTPAGVDVERCNLHGGPHDPHQWWEGRKGGIPHREIRCPGALPERETTDG